MDALIAVWLRLRASPRGRWLAFGVETAWYLFLLWLVWSNWDAPRRAFPYMEG